MSAVREDPTSSRSRGTVEPAFPLSLLESVKANDLPDEILEDEDVMISMPRRLGLTGVFFDQIRRYEEAYRRGRPVAVDEVVNLLRLVLRRDDAERILRETGARIARRAFERRTAAVTSAIRMLPKKAAFAAARRATLQVIRRNAGGGAVELAGQPLVVRVEGGFNAELEPAGIGCTLFAALIEESFQLYLGEKPTLIHSRCGAHGEAWCEWELVA